MLNNKRINTLRKLTGAGFNTTKSILNMTAKDMTALSKSIRDMTDLLEFQDALKGDIIAYFADTVVETEREDG